MSKYMPWILAAALAVSLVFACQELLDIEKNLTNERNAIQRQADSLQSEVVRRDAAIEAIIATMAKRERERDSAQGSWKPVQQEQDAFVLHFDTAGIGAAIDSLNARPIGF